MEGLLMSSINSSWMDRNEPSTYAAKLLFLTSISAHVVYLETWLLLSQNSTFWYYLIWGVPSYLTPVRLVILSFLGTSPGFLPKYFSSDWSFAQFHLPECIQFITGVLQHFSALKSYDFINFSTSKKFTTHGFIFIDFSPVIIYKFHFILCS